MAILDNGFNGGFRGKLGKVVSYPLFGQQIIRTVGERHTPFSEKELANQRKFVYTQQWFDPLTEFLRVGFQGYAQTYQGFVAAKSYNSKNALITDDAGFYIDPARVLVSYGKQSMAAEAEVSSNEKGSVTFNWSKEGPYRYDDRVMLVIYNPEMHKAKFETAGCRRQIGTATLQAGERFSGIKFHAYIAFVSEDRKSRSNSRYLGEIEIM